MFKRVLMSIISKTKFRACVMRTRNVGNRPDAADPIVATDLREP